MSANKSKESRLEEPVPTYDEALMQCIWGLVATIGGTIAWFIF